MSHLLRPFTVEEIKLNLDAEGYISGDVAVDISDVINNDLEGILDLLSRTLVGNDLLMDISYELAGIAGPGILVIKVTGDPSQVIELEEE